MEYYEITKLHIRALENVNDGPNEERKRAGFWLSLNAFHRYKKMRLLSSLYDCMMNIKLKYNFVGTPRKFIIAELSIRKGGFSFSAKCRAIDF